MPRAALGLLSVVLLVSPLQAQFDGTTAPASPAGVPVFHAGQWAARFGVGHGFFGIGALHFTAPDAAWTLSGQANASYRDDGGTDQHADGEGLSLSIGKRWYRPARSRVRPFTGLGISGSFGRNHQVNGPNEFTSRSLGAGVFAELGATIFFAPDLSLGASWSAGLGASHARTYVNDNLVGRSTSVSLNGGAITLEGAFYF